jgi:hypothetical protein
MKIVPFNFTTLFFLDINADLKALKCFIVTFTSVFVFSISTNLFPFPKLITPCCIYDFQTINFPISFLINIQQIQPTKYPLFLTKFFIECFLESADSKLYRLFCRFAGLVRIISHAFSCSKFCRVFKVFFVFTLFFNA